MRTTRPSRSDRSSRSSRALGATALTLALAVGATACGRDEPEGRGAVSATEHNDADVAFASDMLQHHAQALAMVDLTRGRPLDPEVEQLADEIRTAQAPEIETFSDWLGDWGAEIPATMRDHAHAGHGESVGESMQGMDTDMPGMMSADDMTSLAETSDAQFQTEWLEMMLAHHEGALDMARTEIDEGRFSPAVDLAGEISSSQSDEIDTMQELLG